MTATPKLIAGFPSGASTATRRHARLAYCPACKAVVLAGLDEDICARSVRADPRPITEGDELAALLAGRATFNAITDGTRIRLLHRDRWRIASPRRHPVLAAHACPGVVPDWTWLPGHRAADLEEDVCPF